MCIKHAVACRAVACSPSRHNGRAAANLGSAPLESPLPSEGFYFFFHCLFFFVSSFLDRIQTKPFVRHPTHRQDVSMIAATVYQTIHSLCLVTPQCPYLKCVCGACLLSVSVGGSRPTPASRQASSLPSECGW